MPTPTLPKETDEAICTKYKALFALRNRTDAGAVAELIALFHGTPSCLLRHEVAYVLGQMQQASALPFLKAVLCDEDEDPVTRHEAAEALGALGAPECEELLEHYLSDPHVEVSETCQVAIARLQFSLNKGACACEKRPQQLAQAELAYASSQASCSMGAPAQLESQQRLVQAELSDASSQATCSTGAPAPPEPPLPTEEPPTSAFLSVDPATAATGYSTEELRARLLDTRLPLFERYRAMFALRDAPAAKRDAAVLALCDAFGDTSALFKHEIAFVLGQLEHPASVPALTQVLASEDEHPMVRHEAAEALGALGSPDAMDELRRYAKHDVDVLRESCVVALHMYDREAFLAAGICV